MGGNNHYEITEHNNLKPEFRSIWTFKNRETICLILSNRQAENFPLNFPHQTIFDNARRFAANASGENILQLEKNLNEIDTAIEKLKSSV